MKNTPKILFTGLSLFLLLSVSGCHVRNNSVNQTAPGYPVTIKTFDGYSGRGQVVMQTFYKSPERIVATSSTTIDNLIFLGLEDRIVGIGDVSVYNYEPYANTFKRLSKLSPRGYPSKEAILSAKPDIIIGWGSLFGDDALGSIVDWHRRGIKTYQMINTVPTYHTGDRKVRYFIDDLRNLVKIFNIEDQTASINALEARLHTITERTKQISEPDRPKVATIQFVYGNEYSARVASDLTSDIIWLAGGISLDDRLGSRRSIEYLLKQNPDVILLIDAPNNPAAKKMEALKNNPVLRHVNAVKNNSFLAIDQGAFYCGSIRTIEAIERLYEEIHSAYYLSRP